ncbi:hypothetical protein GCM10023262_08860 [Bartonella pachyuromydis]|uniref:Uncharacterized protein n=1 Tax=Bartonella pachyuromydis TaxID=931097 RepID=A0ABP8VHN0_9HYPH
MYLSFQKHFCTCIVFVEQHLKPIGDPDMFLEGLGGMFFCMQCINLKRLPHCFVIISSVFVIYSV